MASYTTVMPIMEQLPKTLSSSETKELFLRFKSGDKEAGDQLKLSNLRLVVSIVNRYENIVAQDSSINCDDLMSTGIIGLIKAINTFNQNKGPKFSTYAARCIENEILALVRKNNRQAKYVSLDCNISDNDTEDDFSLKDVLPSDENIEENYEQKETIEKLREAIKILNPVERQVIELYYGFNGDILREEKIGNQMGCSHTTVSKIKIRSLRKMKEYIEQHG